MVAGAPVTLQLTDGGKQSLGTLRNESTGDIVFVGTRQRRP